ncbi:MAG TPA: hypothetical protein VJ276_23980, partial [Thermoanaerobaculia bacterium]|nr:hypothetical protein [Thermoanaerobaculia bacterium]
MRRPVFLFLLLLAAAPLFAVQKTTSTNIVEDVIRMAKAGVEDDTIIEFVEKYDGRFDVSADDLIALTEAKVSKDVIKAVVDEADSRNEDADKADDDRDDRRDGERRYVRPTYVSPYYVPRYYSPYSYYDPFWYGPRFSIGFGFGYRSY